MGRFERLVSTPALIELFKEKYHIPQEVVVRHCTTEGVEFDRKVGLHGIIFAPIDSALTSVPPTSLES